MAPEEPQTRNWGFACRVCEAAGTSSPPICAEIVASALAIANKTNRVQTRAEKIKTSHVICASEEFMYSKCL